MRLGTDFLWTAFWRRAMAQGSVGLWVSGPPLLSQRPVWWECVLHNSIAATGLGSHLVYAVHLSLSFPFSFFFLTNSGIMKQPDVPHRPCWGASYFRLLKNDSATKQSTNTEVQREVVSSLPMTECQKRSPGSNFLEIHEWTSLLQKTIVVAGSDPKWALLVYPYFIFLSPGPWWENW